LSESSFLGWCKAKGRSPGASGPPDPSSETVFGKLGVDQPRTDSLEEYIFELLSEGALDSAIVSIASDRSLSDVEKAFAGFMLGAVFVESIIGTDGPMVVDGLPTPGLRETN